MRDQSPFFHAVAVAVIEAFDLEAGKLRFDALGKRTRSRASSATAPA
jgi:hypothetical protein